MQADIGAFVRWNALLQKIAIRIQLHRQQIRRIQHSGMLAEIFADAFFLGKRISHNGINLGRQNMRRARKIGIHKRSCDNKRLHQAAISSRIIFHRRQKVPARKRQYFQKRTKGTYLSSALAPAPSSSALIFSASSLALTNSASASAFALSVSSFLV